ncbi:hypothetical protein EWM64_g8643, partial [Hericium alpestre]
MGDAQIKINVLEDEDEDDAEEAASVRAAQDSKRKQLKIPVQVIMKPVTSPHLSRDKVSTNMAMRG